jgi:hypothetical protein
MRPIKYNLQGMGINESRIFTGGWDSIRTTIRGRAKRMNQLFNLRPYSEGQVIVMRTK